MVGKSKRHFDSISTQNQMTTEKAYFPALLHQTPHSIFDFRITKAQADNKKRWHKDVRSQLPVTLNSPGVEHVATGDPEYPPDVSHDSEHAPCGIVPAHPEVTYPALDVNEAGSVHAAVDD